MNKTPAPSSFKNPSLDDEWSSHPAFDWMAEHKTFLLWIFFALIGALIIASRFMTWRTLNEEKDYFQAQTTFTQFEQIAINPEETTAAAADLEKITAIIQSHSELKPKYEGSLAQTLLLTGQIPQAQLFVEDIFKRTLPDHLRLYQDYTRASLLIGEGNFSEALKQTEQLKTDLDLLDNTTSPILYVFNLIRLGMLYQQTNQPENELKTWQEFENQSNRLDAVLAANQILKTGQASINQYIGERRNILK
jgi:hypothetical protein